MTILNQIIVTFRNGKWYYEGEFTYKTMPVLARKGFQCWQDQGTRTLNSKTRNYKFYGANGVKRIWSRERCVSFYLNNLLTREEWIRPVISRLFDKGNYSTKNCVLKEQSENASEVKVTLARVKSSIKNGKKRGKKVILVNVKDSNDKLIFKSASHAAAKLNKVRNCIAVAISRGNNITFKNKKYRPFYEKTT